MVSEARTTIFKRQKKISIPITSAPVFSRRIVKLFSRQIRFNKNIKLYSYLAPKWSNYLIYRKFWNYNLIDLSTLQFCEKCLINWIGSTHWKKGRHRKNDFFSFRFHSNKKGQRQTKPNIAIYLNVITRVRMCVRMRVRMCLRLFVCVYILCVCVCLSVCECVSVCQRERGKNRERFF